jgi:hypothetical protein
MQYKIELYEIEEDLTQFLIGLNKQQKKAQK